MDVSDRPMHVAFINSKGFGGNNATAVVLGPAPVEKMLAQRYPDQYADYVARRATVRTHAAGYAMRADAAELDVIYRFGEKLIDDAELVIDRRGISVPGFERDVLFDISNPWKDMC